MNAELRAAIRRYWVLSQPLMEWYDLTSSPADTFLIQTWLDEEEEGERDGVTVAGLEDEEEE